MDRICEQQGCDKPCKKRSGRPKPHRFCGKHLYEQQKEKNRARNRKGRFGREWYRALKLSLIHI